MAQIKPINIFVMLMCGLITIGLFPLLYLKDDEEVTCKKGNNELKTVTISILSGFAGALMRSLKININGKNDSRRNSDEFNVSNENMTAPPNTPAIITV